MKTFSKKISKPTFRHTLCFRRAAITLLLLLITIFMATRSHGNGWEHGAIPYEALVKALAFESPEMRLRAAQSLGIRGQAEAVEPLLKCLAKPEEKPFVRSAVYIALGKLGDQRGIPVLRACLDEEMREELRSDCVTALGMIGDGGTLTQLLKVLKEDSSFLVQSSVVDALGGFSDEAAVQTLAALVTEDGNRHLRQRAIRALGKTGSQAAVKPLLKALAVSRSDNERLVIVRALTDLRSAEASAPLTKLLHKTENPQLRTQIVIALGVMRDGDAYPILMAMLTDKVPAVRYYAVKSLHDQGRPEAALSISRLSLEISRRLAKRSAQELLSDPVPVIADLSFQVVAVQAITDLDAAKGLQAMLHAARPRSFPLDSELALKLAEGFYRQRRIALNGLGYTRSRQAATFLAGPAGIGDADFRLRAVAVRSLGVLGFSDASEKVIVCLNDPVAEVRWTAAAILGRLKDHKAVRPLMAQLSDVNSEVRRQAALSLGYLGDRQAYEKLSRLAADDGSETVRTAAAYSLQLLEK
jgi:HEAT repeat protein